MKYIVFICDGENVAVRKPLIDSFASKGICGRCEPKYGNKTQMLLSSFGFDVNECENNAAPFVAVSSGISIMPSDEVMSVEFLSNDTISPGEAEMLADGLNSRFGFGPNEFYAGDGENAFLVIRRGADVPDESECAESVKNNSVNGRREKKGLDTVNGCRLFGKSTGTYLPDYFSLLHKRCALTAKNSVARGIARLAKIELYDFDEPDEAFLAKAQAALNAFDDGFDATFVHFNSSKDMLQNADTALTFTVNGLRARGEDYGVLVLFNSSYIMYLPQGENKSEDILRADAVKILLCKGEKYGK